jgi:putative FmdB family regulatory protein
MLPGRRGIRIPGGLFHKGRSQLDFGFALASHRMPLEWNGRRVPGFFSGRIRQGLKTALQGRQNHYPEFRGRTMVNFGDRATTFQLPERESIGMPIYEYQCTEQDNGCALCRGAFEAIQGIHDPPLSRCPDCGRPVHRIISWCRAAVVEISEDHQRVERKIASYEKERMWSHAAELADTHAARVKDKAVKMRALENYEKAGYNTKSLEKHAKTETF